MPQPRDHISTVHTGSLLLSRQDNQIGAWWVGHAVTPHGMVGVYQQVTNDRPEQDYTELIYCLGNRQFNRIYFTYYSKRYTLTLAKRFAREVTEKEG